MPGEFTPPEVGQQAALDAALDSALDSSVQINKSPLPAHGRKPSLKFTIGTTIAGLAVAGCGILGIPNPFVSRGTESPSPMPSGIVEPSNLPTPTATLTETPSIGPSESPPIVPSQTPEVTPRPDTVEQNVADYLDGTTPTPKLFTMFKTDNTPAPLNLVDTKNVDFSKPLVYGEFQAVYLGEVVEYDDAGKPNLLLLLGLRDGTKEDPQNPAKGRLVVKASIGRVNSNDVTMLNTNGGMIITSANAGIENQLLTTSQMQEALKPYQEGSTTMVSAFSVMTGPEVQGPDLPTDRRSKEQGRAQNTITLELLKALITSETKSIPLSKVPMSDALKALIITEAPSANQFSSEIFKPANQPMLGSIRLSDL